MLDLNFLRLGNSSQIHFAVPLHKKLGVGVKPVKCRLVKLYTALQGKGT